MSGDKNQGGAGEAPMSVRQAAIAVLADLDAMGRKVDVATAVARNAATGTIDSIESLRAAIGAERSADQPIERWGLACQGIERMKAGEAIEPDHIHAIVEAAEKAGELSRSFRLRWDADMRAIKRWQAGAPSQLVVAMMERGVELLQLLRAAEGAMARPTPIRPGTEAFTLEFDEPIQTAMTALAGAMDEVRKFSVEAAASRSLIWPDHADLVVWLIELVEHRPACPSLDQVAGLLQRFRSPHFNWSRELREADADAIEGLANALVAASRRVLKAEASATQYRKIAMGADSRVYDSLRTVLQRPDVQEAIAKELCAEAGGDWEAATEPGRDAFRQEAERLLAGALSQPRSG